MGQSRIQGAHESTEEAESGEEQARQVRKHRRNMPSIALGLVHKQPSCPGLEAFRVGLV